MKALRSRQGKTEQIMTITKTGKCLSVSKNLFENVTKAIINLKETIEEKRFSKGESEEDVAKWAEEYEDGLAIAEENVRRLAQQIKEIDRREKHEKTVQDYRKKNLEFSENYSSKG